jgi:hypothetical protein
MLTGIATALLVLLPAAPDRKVAMVLGVSGAVTVERDGIARPVRVMDMLADHDRVTVPADGAAALVFLDDNHREWLQPNTRVAVGADGCTPPAAVKRGESVSTGLTYPDVARLCGTGPGAVVVVRDPRVVKQPPAVTPLFGSTVLTGRPPLSWQPVGGAAGYQVRLVSGRLDTAGVKEQTLWTAQTRVPRLPYPATEKPLAFGNSYSWHVLADMGDGALVVVRSQFAVATRTEVADLARVRPLAARDEPADLLLAALTYHEYGVYDEALAAFERLARLRPREARFQTALADYYARAGRPEESVQALERALKLALTPARSGTAPEGGRP